MAPKKKPTAPIFPVDPEDNNPQCGNYRIGRPDPRVPPKPGNSPGFEFEGKCGVNNLRNGFGQAWFENGDYYEGYYKDGKRDGLGVYVWFNGARYHGEWKEGFKHGFALCFGADGAIYKGWFKKDKMAEGKSLYFFPNNDIYLGGWKNDVKWGEGIYIHTDAKIKYEGYYDKNGRAEGKYIHNIDGRTINKKPKDPWTDQPRPRPMTSKYFRDTFKVPIPKNTNCDLNPKNINCELSRCSKKCENKRSIRRCQSSKRRQENGCETKLNGVKIKYVTS